MKNIRRILIAIFTLLFCFVCIPVAFAHPLGNFTINQYVGLIVSRETIHVDYVVDMAEIPAFQEIALFDTNGNGLADPSEFAAYPADKCASLQPYLNLFLNKKALTLTPISASVEFPAGVGGLPTLRLTCGFESAFDATKDNLELSFTNNAFSERLGWREIVVIAEGISLTGDYSATSLSNRLKNYPQDLLTSPLDQREMKFKIKSISLPAQNGSTEPVLSSQASLTDRNDAFTGLILMEEITLSALLIALAISFIWGAMHAMTPGHGKTIVGAYLVGSRGTMKHALYLGVTTTITHTLGVFVLGLVTLFAAQYILPENLYPWMTLLSGLFVVGIGLNLFAERFKSSGLGIWFGKLTAERAGLQLAYSPSLQEIHIEPSEHKHPHGFVLASGHEGSHDHRQHTHHDYEHHHGNHHEYAHAEHSHMPPETITWRSLLALGISGGLIPCPSALIVLLGAIALNRIGLGLILVLAFSLGLAGALTAIGILFIYAGKLFERFPWRGKIIGVLPVFSALFISLIGLGIIYRAVAEIGMA